MVVGSLFGVMFSRLHSEYMAMESWAGSRSKEAGFKPGRRSAEAKEGFAKAMRIMPGSRIEDRKERQTGIGIGEQIQVIAEIPPITNSAKRNRIFYEL